MEVGTDHLLRNINVAPLSDWSIRKGGMGQEIGKTCSLCCGGPVGFIVFIFLFFF
jgi:hypothetical protein